MKLIKKITRHEMLKRWAIAELNSEFFNVQNEEGRIKILTFLTSNNIKEEEIGINKVLAFKKDLVEWLPLNLQWFLARLHIVRAEMDLIYTLNVPGWETNTKGTFLISTAALNIMENPSLEPRVTGILDALKKKNVEMKGITLLADRLSGPYTAVEGNGRLTSIYIARILEKTKVLGDEIEIVLGIPI